jgi:hypothetical protein
LGPGVPVTEEDIRRAYYANAGAPHTWWITELQMDPPALIVADGDTGRLYRVGYSIGAGGRVEFSAAAEVASYADVAASRGPGPVVVYGSAEESRTLDGDAEDYDDEGYDDYDDYDDDEGELAASGWPAGGDQVVRFTPEQAAGLVDAAVRAGKIPAGRAAYWRGRVMAAGAEGGEAVSALLELAPVLALASGGPGWDDEDTYGALYPVAGSAGPPGPPAGDTYARLYPEDTGRGVRAAVPGPDYGGQPGEDRHEVVRHGPVSVVHSHPHADYSGGVHHHPHVHRADARHDGAGHPHGAPAVAGSGPDVCAARRAEALWADPAGPAGYTDDQLYAALWGE